MRLFGTASMVIEKRYRVYFYEQLKFGQKCAQSAADLFEYISSKKAYKFYTKRNKLSSAFEQIPV